MKPLGINIIPSTSWYDNIRSRFSKTKWDILRKECYKKANHICEICGSTGLKQNFKWPVECHEVWDFNDKTHIQRLVRLIALCPMCHKCQHPGLAQLQGFYGAVIGHYAKVNKISQDEAMNDYDKAFEKWKERSFYDWKLDLTALGDINES